MANFSHEAGFELSDDRQIGISGGIMKISKVELDEKVETFIEAEQEKYETEHGIQCNYTPFCFAV